MSDQKHSFVHDIKIAAPCTADWSKMSGDERARFCGQCKLNVYNISAMTLDEAEELIVEKEGRLCVRLYRRSDGTLITRDCPVGLKLIKQKAQRAYAACATIVAVVFAWVLNYRQYGGAESLWERMIDSVANQPSDAGSVQIDSQHNHREIVHIGAIAPEYQEVVGKMAAPPHHR